MRARRTLAVILTGAAILSLAAAVIFYPLWKTTLGGLLGHTRQSFTNVTDAARLHRHHSGAAWLATFSVSVNDFDNDGHVDLFVNNHERNRPYFYRNLGDGRFEETHEAIGLWENPIGPVFGEPPADAGTPGFRLWLDPKPAIDGTWRLRWTGDSAVRVSGEITTNTWFETVDRIALDASDTVTVERGRIRFDAAAGKGASGLDFRSHYPESTLRLALRHAGEDAPSRVSIGPRGVQPETMPFELSLGDRHASAWGDYDNDGHVDLFVTRGAMVGFLRPPYGFKYEELFRNGGEGRFANVIAASGIRNDYGRGRAAQWVDIDNDGHLDLYVSNLGTRNLLYRNRGDGTFEEVGATSGLDLPEQTHFVWADFDGDGRPDVFFNHPARLFLNQGDGAFKEVSEAWRLPVPTESIGKDTLFWGAGPSVADFDRDGDLDVFLAGGKDGPASLLLENRGGGFVDVTDKAGLSGLVDVTEGIWGDFDNDGHPDLYTLSPHPASNRLFRNNGNGTFSDVTGKMNLALTNRHEWAIPTLAGGVATWIDYDGDGFLDLFLATRRTGKPDPAPGMLQKAWNAAHRYMKGKIQGTHFLLRNTGNDHAWIKIRLVGGVSNRDGYGAKVRVTTAGGTQFQEAGASGENALRPKQRAIAFRPGAGQEH